jgi:hypothetical protein
VRNALKTMQVTTDCNDGRAIAQLIRLGWFRPGQTEPRLPAGALTRPAAEQQRSCGRASGRAHRHKVKRRSVAASSCLLVCPCCGGRPRTLS